MEPKAPAPDGGWGWMVVIGAALINMVNQAMFANFGLIYGEKLKDMANGHATGITLVLAINLVVTNVTGLVVGPLLKKISLRTLTFIGITCVGSGLIATSFATEIWHIVIGYSFSTGFGLGLLASGTFLVINEYFTTKKSTAVGISMAGTAIGQMIMPTFIGILLKKYEFSGTTFILGFVSYSGCIGALFFKPLFCCKKNAGDDTNAQEKGTVMEEINVNGKNAEEGEKLLSQGKEAKGRGQEKKGMIGRGIDKHYEESAIEVANSQFVLNKEEEKYPILRKIASSLGLDLLKDFYFVFTVLGLGLVYVSAVSYNAFNPMFLQDEAMLTMLQTTSCMTAMSSADVVGRITMPEITRRFSLSNRKSFMLGCVLLAMVRTCLVELTNFQHIFATSFIVGYFRAVTVINQNLVISEYISKEKLPSAVGLNMVVKALLSGTVGQSLGLLKDQFSYRISIHVLNATVFFVIASWLIYGFIQSLRTPKKIDASQEKTIQET